MFSAVCQGEHVFLLQNVFNSLALRIDYSIRNFPDSAHLDEGAVPLMIEARAKESLEVEKIPGTSEESIALIAANGGARA